MYPEQTTVTVKITSDAFSSVYSSEISVPEEGVVAEIPIKEKLSLGNYNITYTMTLSNGKEITESGTISIVAPDSLEMNVGDEEVIPSSSVISCVSSDESIVNISGGKIIAKSPGIAYVSVISESNNSYCAKITVLASNTNDTSSDDDSSNSSSSSSNSSSDSSSSSNESSSKNNSSGDNKGNNSTTTKATTNAAITDNPKTGDAGAPIKTFGLATLMLGILTVFRKKKQ
jgi:hypothetical protein